MTLRSDTLVALERTRKFWRRLATAEGGSSRPAQQTVSSERNAECHISKGSVVPIMTGVDNGDKE